MIRFSAQGAYLLLIPQGRALIRYRALISFFEKQPHVQNKTLIFKEQEQNHVYKAALPPTIGESLARRKG